MEIIKKFRKYRSEKLSFLMQPLAKLGVTANMLTALSLLSGLLAVYFMFNNSLYFILFVLLHFLFDSFDGVLARITKSTSFGKYFDLAGDSLVTLLVLVKAGWFLQDYYVYLISGLFLLGLIIHFFSKLEAPMIFMRTPVLIGLVIATYPLFPFTVEFLTLAYLTAGVVAVYSLAKQLQWYVKRRK